MNFVIDIGNTFTKLAVFQSREMAAFTSFEGVDVNYIRQFCDQNQLIENAIVSTVREYPPELDAFLGENFNVIFFTHDTPVPVINKYITPETLGKDRLAGVIGARQLMPQSDVLVIDAGTALTYDLITSAGEYQGGSISPGIAMRYMALHTFTGRLPLLDFYDDATLTGNNTKSCIQSGVLNGALAEIEGIIASYKLIYPALKIILTGGDHNYFDKRLKIKTFAAPNLVLEGLNLILNFNIETL
jgi:type III pantothenate kinase